MSCMLSAMPIILVKHPLNCFIVVDGLGQIVHTTKGGIMCKTWWRHQMETFSALLAICEGHKGQWRGALMLSLVCDWISGWVNNREAGDLRRYRVHCDVIVVTLGPEQNVKNTVKPIWKGQECFTKFVKFGPFPRTILYKSCLFCASQQATSFEKPPFWVAFIEGFHCILQTF